MAMAIAPSTPGHYTTTIVPANPSIQQPQPQIHQAMSTQSNPLYQQSVGHVQAHQLQERQQQQQQPPQQVVQTRIVHVSHRQVTEEQTSKPNRQFVTFKNLRHLNTPGAQWEHCEHITIALSPDEMDRKVRCHDVPGNDLTHCLTSMGLYRQRHVKKYEEKLNQRETDPSNWNWVLEALGELRDKPKATPHTFWAIFARTSRKTGNVQGAQGRAQPQVTIHHEPAHVIETTQETPQISMQPAMAHALTAPQQAALPAPPTVPATQLALPAPPSSQPIQTTFSTPAYSTPAAYILPAQSIGATTSKQQYLHSDQQHPLQPSQARAPHAYQQYQQPQVLHAQYQQAPVQQAIPSQALATLPSPPMSRPALVRQLTAEASTTSREYTRPIPRPYSPTRRGVSPVQSFRSSEIDVHQYQVRDHSPVRPSSSRMRERERWFDDDNMSDDSTSSYGSRSSSATSMTEYSFSKVRAPLGTHNSKSRSSSRRRRNHESSRHRSSQHGQMSRVPIVPAPPPPRMAEEKHYSISTAPARPTLQRQNTYDVEVRFGTTTARPASLPRRSADSAATPRSYASRREEDDDSESEEERYGKAHHQSSHVNGHRSDRTGHHHGGRHQAQMHGTCSGNGYPTPKIGPYGGHSAGVREKRY